MGQRPNRGLSPDHYFDSLTARHSLASQRAAKPEQKAPNDFFVQGHVQRETFSLFQPFAAQEAVEESVLDFAVDVPALAEKAFTLEA